MACQFRRCAVPSAMCFQTRSQRRSTSASCVRRTLCPRKKSRVPSLIHCFLFLWMTDVFFLWVLMMIRLFTQTLLVVSLICSACRARKVDTAEELVSIFADATEVVNENIKITSDLDFSSSSLSLPLGARTVGSCVPYSGTLKGHGHTISRLAINNKNSETTKFKNAGLFCKL